MSVAAGGRGPGRMWLTRGMVLGDLMVSVVTGQHSEEGHRSADSGEERAAGGPEGQERWYH